ncbi:MAG TPA: hypothetical protein VLA19_06095 [Herpetosiphonaceae bacterium]|nr:hypothetical protein [Herpetosiphonaceae bacterium]
MFDAPVPIVCYFPTIPAPSWCRSPAATTVWLRQHWPASHIALGHAFLTADWLQTDALINYDDS